jgi:hypothetical protein
VAVGVRRNCRVVVSIEVPIKSKKKS